jgi:hypothetical protein
VEVRVAVSTLIQTLNIIIALMKVLMTVNLGVNMLVAKYFWCRALVNEVVVYVYGSMREIVLV